MEMHTFTYTCLCTCIYIYMVRAPPKTHALLSGTSDVHNFIGTRMQV